jgi:hypothetical protein
VNDKKRKESYCKELLEISKVLQDLMKAAKNEKKKPCLCAVGISHGEPLPLTEGPRECDIGCTRCLRKEIFSIHNLLYLVSNCGNPSSVTSSID